jgi:hypothetical protein
VLRPCCIQSGKLGGRSCAGALDSCDQWREGCDEHGAGRQTIALGRGTMGTTAIMATRDSVVAMAKAANTTAWPSRGWMCADTQRWPATQRAAPARALVSFAGRQR